MLKIFNTLTKKKEIFKPINLNKVKLYVCGVTAYDLCHVGHGRTFVIFDTVVRYLNYCGYQVEYVRNITDIDDKIIQKAYVNNETIDQLTNRMITEMYIDLDKLNILRPNFEPKVTENIDMIISFICLLIKKKHAYIATNGDVVFSVKSYNNHYGILSRRISSNTCVANNNNIFNLVKQNTKDFVLWKSVKPKEPYWKSPWGKGRPGWHIECSAMSCAILGKQIDIHGGGLDLIFPHHDNEIAQSICAYNDFQINLWMHSGMLLLNNEKMSKSLSNFVTIRELLKNYDSETIRFFLLSAHYRKQLQYNVDNLKNAQTSLKHFYIALRGFDLSIQPTGGEYFVKKFSKKMNDDFNTPEAYAVLFELTHELNILKTNKNYLIAQGIAATLKYLANILGILYQNPETYLQSSLLNNNDNNTIRDNYTEIQELIQIRKNARKSNQWKLADNIRNKLRTMGIVLEDESTGETKWRYNFK